MIAYTFMQHKIFLLLALSLLIASACSRDRESPQTQQPATTVEPESMMEEEMDSDEPIEMDTFPHQETTGVLWSADSTRLAVIDGDGAWLYDLNGDQITRQRLGGNADRATSVAFSLNGEQIAVGFADGQIQLWDVASGELIVQFAGHEAPVQSLALNPDGTMLASGAGQWFADFVPRAEGVETRLWDISTGDLRRVLAQDMIEPPVSHLAFSPDGAVLAVGQQGHGCASPRCADGRLRFWWPETNAITEMVVGHDIAISDNGRLVAALGQIYESGQVQIWELGTGSKLPSAKTVPEGFAFDLALSQDGSTAAVVMGEYGYGGQTANVWDVGTGEELAVVESSAPIALSANGCFLVSSPVSDPANGQIVTPADNWLRLWDVRQGSELVRLVEIEDFISQLALSPDNAWLAATEIDVMDSQLHLIAIPQPQTP